jgi:BASS family bile acid:Na+ symporter
MDLQQFALILLMLSVFLIVLALGMQGTADDILFMWRNPTLLFRAFVAISVVVPIVAVLVVDLLPLRPLAKLGVIAMSIAPLPPLFTLRDLKAGARRSYVVGLYVSLLALSVLIIPATAAVLGVIFQRAVAIPMPALLRIVAVTMALPLALGLGLRRFWPKLAAAAALWVSRMGFIAVIAISIPLVVKLWPLMMSMTGDGTVLAIAAIIAAALTGGHFLGGRDERDRLALGTAAAMRHPGIALSLATANGQDKRVIGVILLFLLIGAVMVTAYQAWFRRTHAAAGDEAAAPG